MIPDGNIQSNIERFSGFENLYDRHRPEAPQLVVELLHMYLNRRPGLVIDLGCGTGLSSFIWVNHADRIIGIEPNDDMIRKAREKALARSQDGTSHLSFMQGYSNHLEIESGTADIITCSQCFHWMDPVSTLQEVSRVLRDGGVFAAYDCDWPPIIGWAIEDKYKKLVSKADTIAAQRSKEGDGIVKRDKEQHLKNMQESRVFRYTRELVFHNKETCDAERYVGLAMSQGGLQTAMKLGATELEADIEQFKSSVNEHFRGRTLEIMFGYRMRLGIK